MWPAFPNVFWVLQFWSFCLSVHHSLSFILILSDLYYSLNKIKHINSHSLHKHFLVLFYYPQLYDFSMLWCSIKSIHILHAILVFSLQQLSCPSAGSVKFCLGIIVHIIVTIIRLFYAMVQHQVFVLFYIILSVIFFCSVKFILLMTKYNDLMPVLWFVHLLRFFAPAMSVKRICYNKLSTHATTGYSSQLG